ncbi:The BTB (BR-C, ttk and bab)/POZ (Pox virus and Zinc finger) domain [Ceratobasidium sp. AG-Ba]|nr:The BTB (BR-C, ttk and bab)/POZ (Pox virus and Zinc finger) domain [Ceratobasidium sp. AG-Ba]
MLSTTGIADVVELSEDSEAISLVLAFIYPVMRSPIQPITLLEKSMLVAYKYKIDGLAQTLEKACIQQRPLIRRDPVRIFRATVDYGFHETQKVAGIVEVAKMLPHSAHIIGAVGA